MLLAPLLVTLAIAAPPTGRWSVDETGRVPPEVLAQFDVIARTLDSSGAGQLGLAVVRSTNGESPRGFATRVFNQWGVGHAGSNDGVLLFFALDDRKSEIVMGDGFSGYQSTTDAIMRDDVVANMKAQRLDLAITRAAASLAAYVQQAGAPGQAPSSAEPPAPLPEVKEHSPRAWLLDLDLPLSPSQAAPLNREGDAVYASGKGLLFVALFEASIPTSRYAEALRAKLHREDVWVVFAPRYGPVLVDAPGAKRIFEDVDRACRQIEAHAHQRRDSGDDVVDVALEAMHRTAGLVVNGAPPKSVTEVVGETYEEHKVATFGGFGAFGLLGLVSFRAWNRRRPRSCERCQNPRHKLSEETDDPHLNPGQRVEEQLGSVDYDVWWCGRCNDALVLRYGAIFSSYSNCASCQSKTLSSSTTTLVEATYSHGGTVQVDERCQHCSYTNTYTRHTAQLTRDDSSSSSWSSSSDSSFGGGSSSGGGSSGSW